MRRNTLIGASIAVVTMAATTAVGLALVGDAGSSALNPPGTATSQTPGTATPGNSLEIPPGEGLPAAPVTDEGPEDTVASTVPGPTDTPGPSKPPSSSSTTSPPRPADPGFPTSNPLRIEGASTSFYMESNDFQASLYGLNPGDVRTWGMDFATGSDAESDYRRIVSGIRDSGFTIVSDGMQGNLDGTVGTFAGKYKNWTFQVTLINRTQITFSLLNWQSA